MAFQTGSQINPALGAINYTPYLQGSLAGSQAIGQGLANLGQSFATGIEKYYQKKEENQLLDNVTNNVAKRLEANPELANRLGVRLDENGKPDYKGIRYTTKAIGAANMLNGINTMDATLTAEQSSNRAAQYTLNMIREQEANQELGQTPEGVVAGPVYRADPIPKLTAVERLAAERNFLARREANASIAKTFAEAGAAGVPKPTEMVWPTQEAARAAGVQANPGFDIKVNPTKGGWTFNAVEKPQPTPDTAGAAIVAAQVPLIQESFNRAESVPLAIENIHKQKDLVNSGEVPTGILAPVQTYIDRLGALFGNKSSEAAAARTAEYDKLISQSTFDAMKASGLKASQLNTEKEWERFNQAIAASRSNPREAALAILDLNEKAQRAILDQHNKKLKSGSFKRFLDNSMISYPTIEQPPAYAQPAAGGGNVIRTYDPVTGTLK